MCDRQTEKRRLILRGLRFQQPEECQLGILDDVAREMRYVSSLKRNGVGYSIKLFYLIIFHAPAEEESGTAHGVERAVLDVLTMERVDKGAVGLKLREA